MVGHLNGRLRWQGLNRPFSRHVFSQSQVLYLWVAPKENLFKFTLSPIEYALCHLDKKFQVDFKNDLKKFNVIQENDRR